MSADLAARPLAGQVAFVTGASRGIGRAIAIHLASLGADVAVGGRDLDALAAVVAEVEALGVRGFGLRFEVTDTPSLPALVAEIEAALGPIDILVNNAGVNRLRLALDVTEDDWDFVLGHEPAGRVLRGPGGRSGDGGARARPHRERRLDGGVQGRPGAQPPTTAARRRSST